MNSATPIYLVPVAHPPEQCGAALRALTLRTPEPATWLFLGHDPHVARCWERVLGERLQRIETAQLLDETARELQTPFTNWVDSLNEKYDTDPAWWFTSFAERNTLASPLFLLMCYLAVAANCLTSDRAPRLIVTESWGLIDDLCALIRSLGLEARVLAGWRRPIAWSRHALRGVAALGYFVLNAFNLVWAAHRTRAGGGRPTFGAPGRRVLLATYFHESNLAHDGVFRDRYFPFLHEWLAQQGREVWILPTLVDRVSPPLAKYRWMRKSTARFIIPEDWLTLSDYIGALLDGFRAMIYPHTVGLLAGKNVSGLVREERWRQASTSRARQAGLLFRLPARLCTSSFVPEQIIAWSENQVVDKARVLGCRRAFPQSPYVAVQNTPLFSNWMGQFYTPGECRAGLAADYLVCSGPLPAKLMAERSGGLLRTRVGCALRYHYLWKGERPALRPVSAVVVTLPIAMPDAAELLDTLQSLRERWRDLRWHVKLHPDYTLVDLERVTGVSVQNIPWTILDGSLADWLEKMDVLITTGSGTAIEAAAMGLPVILVGSRTRLNLNPLEWFGEPLAKILYTTEQIAERLEEIMRQAEAGAETSARRAREIREAWFAPVTDNGLRQFLA